MTPEPRMSTFMPRECCFLTKRSRIRQRPVGLVGAVGAEGYDELNQIALFAAAGLGQQQLALAADRLELDAADGGDLAQRTALPEKAKDICLGDGKTEGF